MAGKVVFKKSDGKRRAKVEIRESSEFSNSNVNAFMGLNAYDLIEDFIEQHREGFHLLQ